ncbi:hypothetical protein ACJJTC_009707 [Scirpophaga incertulas]
MESWLAFCSDSESDRSDEGSDRSDRDRALEDPCGLSVPHSGTLSSISDAKPEVSFYTTTLLTKVSPFASELRNRVNLSSGNPDRNMTSYPDPKPGTSTLDPQPSTSYSSTSQLEISTTEPQPKTSSYYAELPGTASNTLDPQSRNNILTVKPQSGINSSTSGLQCGTGSIINDSQRDTILFANDPQSSTNYNTEESQTGTNSVTIDLQPDNRKVIDCQLKTSSSFDSQQNNAYIIDSQPDSPNSDPPEPCYTENLEQNVSNAPTKASTTADLQPESACTPAASVEIIEPDNFSNETPSNAPEASSNSFPLANINTSNDGSQETNDRNIPIDPTT